MLAGDLKKLISFGLVAVESHGWALTPLGKAVLAMDTRTTTDLRIVVQEIKCPTCKFEWDLVEDEEFVYADQEILCLTGCCFFRVSDDAVKCWAQTHDRLCIVPVPPQPGCQS
jgi:hypothetical protein